MMATNENKIDRAINATVAVGFLAWSGLLWDTSTTLGTDLKTLAEQNAVTLERINDLMEDMVRHERGFAHEGAREALHALQTSLTRTQDRTMRFGETSEKRDDIHMNRITELEARVRALEP